MAKWYRDSDGNIYKSKKDIPADVDYTTYKLPDKSDWNDDYYANNMLNEGNTKQLHKLIEMYLTTGVTPTKEEFEYKYNYNLSKDAWNNLSKDLNTFRRKNKIDQDEYKKLVEKQQYIENPELSEQEEEAAKEAAYNAYYRDMFSPEKEGTFGADMLARYTEAEERAAESNMQLAEAQYQQAAMQQAEVVKSITDQVKAERMARLRAGMSESQIANQDMQMMLNNMNTLNQQAATMNQNRLAAQQQYNLAQDTAYQQYINSATGLGSVNAAMAASDAGDAYMQALKYQRQNGGTFTNAYNKVTGGK